MRNPWAETEDGNGLQPIRKSNRMLTELFIRYGCTKAIDCLWSSAHRDFHHQGIDCCRWADALEVSRHQGLDCCRWAAAIAASRRQSLVCCCWIGVGCAGGNSGRSFRYCRIIFLTINRMLKSVTAAPKPRQVDTRHHKLPPNHIRDARKEYVDQYARTGEVSEEIVGRAFGMPKVLCDNSGCDQLHIADDCELPLLCEACISKDHTRTTCEAKCTRCGGPGHSLNRCSASKVFGKQVKLTTPKVLQDIPPRSGELLVRTPKAPLQARLWKQAQLRARELGLPHQSTALVAVPKLSAPASASAVKPPPTSSPTSFAAVIGRDLPASKAPSSLATNVATSSTLSAPERERIVSTHAGPGSIFATGSRSCVPATDVRLSQMTAGETRSIATPADTRSSQMTATATSSVSDSLMEREFASPRVCHLCGEKTKHKPQDCPQRKCFKCQQKG